MNLVQAISSVFRNYVGFSGRACRSEYWYWALVMFITSIILSVLDVMLFGVASWSPLSTIFTLAILLPGIAVSIRRLHDRDKSGWWALLAFIPLIGTIILIVWFVGKGTDGSNRFGADPLASAGTSDASTPAVE